MLTREQAQTIKKMVDELEDLYYNRGKDIAENGIYADTESPYNASIAFVEYVESLVDPDEVVDKNTIAYQESQYH